METMTAYILAAALGIAIAIAIYLYNELSFERAASASKRVTIEEQDKTIKVMYDKIMRMHRTLDSDARLIESLNEDRHKLKKQRDEALKATKVSQQTYTINVDSDEVVKELMKQIREKYGRNFQ